MARKALLDGPGTAEAVLLTLELRRLLGTRDYGRRGEELDAYLSAALLEPGMFPDASEEG